MDNKIKYGLYTLVETINGYENDHKLVLEESTADKPCILKNMITAITRHQWSLYTNPNYEEDVYEAYLFYDLSGEQEFSKNSKLYDLQEFVKAMRRYSDKDGNVAGIRYEGTKSDIFITRRGEITKEDAELWFRAQNIKPIK